MPEDYTVAAAAPQHFVSVTSMYSVFVNKPFLLLCEEYVVIAVSETGITVGCRLLGHCSSQECGIIDRNCLGEGKRGTDQKAPISKYLQTECFPTFYLKTAFCVGGSDPLSFRGKFLFHFFWQEVNWIYDPPIFIPVKRD